MDSWAGGFENTFSRFYLKTVPSTESLYCPLNIWLCMILISSHFVKLLPERPFMMSKWIKSVCGYIISNHYIWLNPHLPTSSKECVHTHKDGCMLILGTTNELMEELKKEKSNFALLVVMCYNFQIAPDLSVCTKLAKTLTLRPHVSCPSINFNRMRKFSPPTAISTTVSWQWIIVAPQLCPLSEKLCS